MDKFIELINKHEILKELDLRRLVITYINDKKILDYVKKFDIKSLDNCDGSYNSNTKTLILDRTSIINKCLNNDTLNNYKIDYINFSLLKCLFHELTHAKQQKELEENNNLMMNFCLNKQSTCYKDLYFFFPNEREARINGLINTIILFQRSNTDENLINSYLINLFDEILDGYYLFGNTVVNPFKSFYKYANLQRDYNYITYEYQNKDLFVRLLYGLEISNEEYFYLQRIYNLINNNFIDKKVNIKKLILSNNND